jgi:hypothetical protein
LLRVGVDTGGSNRWRASVTHVRADPIQGGCANPYTYAFGDPLNHPDLSGQALCPEISAQTALTIGKALTAGADAGEIASLLPIGGVIGNFVARILAVSAGYYGALFTIAARVSINSFRAAKLPTYLAKVAIYIPTLQLPFIGNTPVPIGAPIPVPVVFSPTGTFKPC